MSKCSECGFLALRLIYSRHLVDAEDSYRDSGTIPTTHIRSGDLYGEHRHDVQLETHYEKYPICFRLAADLKDEVRDYRDAELHLAAITKERTCDKFTKWKQGFTPKEHAEMMLSEELIQADRVWREEQTERERQWRREDVELAKQAMKITVRSYLVGAMIGGALTLASVALAKWLG